MTTAFSASLKQQAVEKTLRRGRGVTLGTLADEWGCILLNGTVVDKRIESPNANKPRRSTWRYDNRKTTAGLDSCGAAKEGDCLWR